MKRFFALALIAIMLITSCSNVCALDSGVTKFTITPVRENFKDKYIYINVTAPQKVTNAKMLVGFYRNGRLTKLVPLDISSKNTFNTQKVNITESILVNGRVEDIDKTPNEIKIFTWDKNNLMPRTLCDNVLTPEVIKKANANVVNAIKIIPEATDHICNNLLLTEEDYLAGDIPEWDESIFRIMWYLNRCARGALNSAETHLLTSPYAQDIFSYEISEIRRLMSNASEREKTKLKGFMGLVTDATKLPDEYLDALNTASKFLGFSLTAY